MKQAPTFYTLEGLQRTVAQPIQAGLPDGRWVPARPVGHSTLIQRFKLAVMVFFGHADVVKWPGQ